MSTPSALLIDSSLSKESETCPFSSLESVETAIPVRRPTSFSVRPSFLRMARMVSPGVDLDSVSFGAAGRALMRESLPFISGGNGLFIGACNFQKRNLLSHRENYTQRRVAMDPRRSSASSSFPSAPSSGARRGSLCEPRGPAKSVAADRPRRPAGAAEARRRADARVDHRHRHAPPRTGARRADAGQHAVGRGARAVRRQDAHRLPGRPSPAST